MTGVTGVTGVTVRAAKPADEGAVLRLLEAEALPTAEVSRWLDGFVVAEVDGEVVGAAGLEEHGADGLLRSVVVARAHRGRGIAAALTEAVLTVARASGLRAVYLLTTTAASWFPRFGFRTIARARASDDVRASVEFMEACPASATVMVLELSTPSGPR